MTTSQSTSDPPVASQAKMFRHGLILGLFCLGFGLLLAVIEAITLDDIGAAREIIVFGTLFADASLLPGPSFKGTGLLVVGKRLLDQAAGKEIQMSVAHSVVRS